MPQPNGPTMTLWLNKSLIIALLDSGSLITLAQPSVLPQSVQTMGTLLVTCVHGDVREVTTADDQSLFQR